MAEREEREEMLRRLLACSYGSEGALDLVEEIEDRFGAREAEAAVRAFEGGCFRPEPATVHTPVEEPPQVWEELEGGLDRRGRWHRRRELEGACVKCGREREDKRYRRCSVCLARERVGYMRRHPAAVKGRYRSKHDGVLEGLGLKEAG